MVLNCNILTNYCYECFNNIFNYMNIFKRNQNLILNNGYNINIGEQLAEGGFGYVFIAYDKNNKNNKYALKKMICMSQEQCISAEQEIKYMNMFEHEYIMPLLDHSTSTKEGANTTMTIFWMLMPYAHLGSLRKVLDIRVVNQGISKFNHDLLTENEIYHYFIQICEAISVLHHFDQQGLGGPFVHRDIKPENIMMCEGSKCLLTDFGSVSPALISVTNRSEALGVQEIAATFCTISYRAPELFDVPSVIELDTRTDIWSLGCLLFSMAFGYSPFESEFILDKDDQHINIPKIVECTYLRVISGVSFPSYSPYSNEFHELITWILQQEPGDRPFVEDILDRVLELYQPNNINFEPPI